MDSQLSGKNERGQLGVTNKNGRVWFEINDTNLPNGQLGYGASIQLEQNSVGYWELMHYVQDVGSYTIASDEFMLWYDGGTGGVFRLAGNGNLTIAGSLSQNSDLRLKKDVKTVSNALDKIKLLNGVEFSWMHDHNNVKNLGIIAQDAEAVFPELVSEKDNIKNVNYIGLIPVLIESVKSLSGKIQYLENCLLDLNKNKENNFDIKLN